MNARQLFLIGTLSAAAALPAVAQDAVTLKIAHFLPSVAPAQQKVLQPWCDELGEASNGRIQCQFFPAMQLGGTPAQLADQVKNGVADVVWTAPGYSAGRFPAIEAFELPFTVQDSTSSSRALWQYYQQHAQQEFAAYKVLAFHTDGGQAVHTSSKPVAALKDFAGLKLRTSTRLGAKTLQALGGAPVAMPPAQVTEAIAKGVVDGSLGSWELVLPTKLSEVTKFHLQPEAGAAYPTATVLMVLMNKRKYDSLPADLKALIDQTTGETMAARFGEVFDGEAAETRKRVAAEGGKIITLTAAEVAALRKATAAVDAEWVKQVGERGLDGNKLLNAARTLSGTHE